MPMWAAVSLGALIGITIGFFGGVLFARKTTIQITVQHFQLVFTTLMGLVALLVWVNAMGQEAASLGAYKVPLVLHFIVASVVGLPIGTLLNMFKSDK